ncbi:nucleotide-binding universal stress UspA family protein [Caulobacter ginsengisoli]|uniref:Nucleotide-binding universal stress UspA family protein n=1 Tax=Caulobacter ginsengisoli TaxID=400775 RepID=A0ABU0IQG0_9CAUL|nr:universal stress protein [Caulobacter ginsengisoli]MDQ0463635.1 nucleotide-binding universal stress UspA family protein [Caulobacter ginsengisoli]
MALNDILLHIDSYPDPTPNAAIDEAVALAAKLGGRVTAQAFAIQIPLRRNAVADRLVGLSGLAREEEARSLAACQTSLAHFATVASEADVFKDTRLPSSDLYDLDAAVAVQARTHDLTIVPFGSPMDGQRSIAEAAIFGSGRPVLAFRTGKCGSATSELGVVVIAWDGSRAAARALADALPVLARAREVRILTILNDKPAAGVGLGAEAARHLAAHGVSAKVEEVDAKGRKIGAVLDDYLASAKPDLLVMGAYGHSRLREFVLGGATEHMLFDPPVPVLLSH